MKRGLVYLDPAEVSLEEQAERVSRLRAAMADAGVDVALIYGDVYRADDIRYLTNLSIYWNEGMLAVPTRDAVTFLTKLSPRVHPWMRRISTLTALRSGPSFKTLAAGLLEDADPGVLGLVDGGLWPATVVEQIRAALPGWQVRLLPGLVRSLRLAPSPSEIASTRQGSALVRDAVDAAAGMATPTERPALLERMLRGAGFTDVVLHPARTGDGTETIDVTAEYRHGWIRAARIVHATDDPPAWQDAPAAAIRVVGATLALGASEAELTAAAQQALEDLPPGATALLTFIMQADLGSQGDYESWSFSALRPGSVFTIEIEVLFEDGGRAVAAELVHLTEDGLEWLTAAGTVEPAGSLVAS